jgi:hypothetical protein
MSLPERLSEDFHFQNVTQNIGDFLLCLFGLDAPHPNYQAAYQRKNSAHHKTVMNLHYKLLFMKVKAILL